MNSIPRRPLPIAFLAFPDVHGLDLAGTLEVFARATRLLREQGHPHPGYSLTVVAEGRAPLRFTSGLRFLPDRTLSELRGPVDTLLVAGGIGVHAAVLRPRMVAWLRRWAPRVRRLCSVCTGAFLLAEAGLLDGRRAATHWSRADELQQRYPRVRVEADAIWVRDGNLFTSAGVSAGLDLALALVEEDLGTEVALAVARAMVIYLRRPGGQSQFSAPLRLQSAEQPSVRDLVAWAAGHPAADLSVPALAKRLALSPRQLSRVFQRELGESPAHAIEQLRLEAAQRALSQSQAGLEEVAARAGFGSAEVMRRAFIRKLRLAPSEYRERFGARERRAS